MAKAAHALSAPISGRNPLPALYRETAALLHEWSVASRVRASLPSGLLKEHEVCRQVLEMPARLGRVASASGGRARHD
jgi:hypothetical protein